MIRDYGEVTICTIKKNSLEHSAKGTTWEKKNHKYVTKKFVNGRWLYLYPYDNGESSKTDNFLSKENIERGKRISKKYLKTKYKELKTKYKEINDYILENHSYSKFFKGMDW